MSNTRETYLRECRAEYDKTHGWDRSDVPTRHPPVRYPPIRYPYPYVPPIPVKQIIQTGGIKPIPGSLGGLGCGCDSPGEPTVNVDSHASLEIDPMLKWGLLIGLALLVLKR